MVDLLRRRGDALFAQDIDRGIEIAIGFAEGAFAIHQSGIGHFPELAHVCSSKFSHTKQV